MATGNQTGNQSALLGLLRFALIALTALTGLGTIFVGVITAFQAWQEHAQQHWPTATAYVEKCAMVHASAGRRLALHIRCRLHVDLGTEQPVAYLYSMNVPPPEVRQSPPNQIAPFIDWVNRHPAGTSIEVRYNPSRHTSVVPVTDPIPRTGPHTPDNLKLLAATSISFVVLLILLRATWPRSVQLRKP
ncbi:DUF3592 domain-containing protein [Acidicapsa dinghuensis]|uniref:DUF3592 domain-containing protein n=1 Tax=Acidicapsa dinghuensis TaxID=2218256 RepID=A0ABW1EJP3_9BACT|nr:DUF3592 domain-containing protein [Acidicapsa dinghuensis]